MNSHITTAEQESLSCVREADELFPWEIPLTLSPTTQKAVVKALNTAFDASEVASLLDALSALQATSPSSKAGTHNFNLYVPGRYYEPYLSSVLNPATYQGIVNRIDLSPFFCNEDLKISELSINTVTGVVATEARVLIYDSNVDGWPDRKVFESGPLATTTSTTVSSQAVDFEFKAGVVYWLGAHFNGTPVVRGLRDYSTVSLGLTDNTASSNGAKTVGRIIAYGSAPSNWNFTVADLSSILTGPVVRFRVA